MDDGSGEYWGEILGEILEIGGLTLAQTGSLRTEGTGLNTPLLLYLYPFFDTPKFQIM